MRQKQPALQVIVGLGKTGLSCARFCLREQLPFAVIDSREAPPELSTLKTIAPHVPLSLGSLESPWLAKADRLTVSPGVSLQEKLIAMAMAKGIPVVGDLELFTQKAQAPIVAITGSNAKSTVTAWVGEMAKRAGKSVVVAGNIGIPVLETLSEVVPDLYVLEVSSFQLETTFSLRAQAATILNVTEDHMDRYRSLADYASAKQRIYSQETIAVFNRADFRTQPSTGLIQSAISFGLGSAASPHYGLVERQGKLFLAKGSVALCSANDLKLTGKHQIENALAALAFAEAAGLAQEACLETLKTFQGLPHRCQWVREWKGIQWYSDSKGTNVGATLAAIQGLGDKGPIILIAGGRGKNADFKPLQTPVARYVREAILLGEAQQILANVLEHHCKVTCVSTLEDAISHAAHIAQPGDQVLLSPACASLDMFKNYEHRGEVFEQCVRKL